MWTSDREHIRGCRLTAGSIVTCTSTSYRTRYYYDQNRIWAVGAYSTCTGTILVWNSTWKKIWWKRGIDGRIILKFYQILIAINAQIVALWIRQSDNLSGKKVKEKVKVKFT